MNVQRILDRLADAGVCLYLAGPDDLRYQAKPGAYTQTMRDFVRRHRAAIVAYLADELDGNPWK